MKKEKVALSHENYSDETFASQYYQFIQNNLYNAQIEQPAFQSILPNTHGLDVIDLGCAGGTVAKVMANQNPKSLHVLDYSEAMLNLAKAELSGSTQFHLHDLNHPLPFPNNAFDGITASLVFHYIQNLPKLFENLGQIMRPNGWLVFSVIHPELNALNHQKTFAKPERIKDYWPSFDRYFESYARSKENLEESFLDYFEITSIIEPTPLIETKNGSAPFCIVYALKVKK